MRLYDGLIKFAKKNTCNNDEEAKRMIMLLRVLMCCVFLYLLGGSILCVVTQIRYGLVMNSALILLLAGMFTASYYLSKYKTVVIFNLGMTLWITLNIWLYGWSSGVQNFLLLLILVYYFASYDNLHKKIGFSVIIFIVYMALYLNFVGRENPDINLFERYLIRGANIFVMIFCLSIVSYIFSFASHRMEGELIAYNVYMTERASQDALTGLYNRGKVMEILHDLSNKGELFSICICDIDFFKKVNDNYGHCAGDKVLQSLAETFKALMPDNEGYVARWGGEEFFLIFLGLSGEEALEKLFFIQDKIRESSVDYEGQKIKINLTYGLTEYSHTKPLDDNIKEADHKLYCGKKKGRDIVVF